MSNIRSLLTASGLYIRSPLTPLGLGIPQERECADVGGRPCDVESQDLTGWLLTAAPVNPRTPPVAPCCL
jgi:hypothetical protein